MNKEEFLKEDFVTILHDNNLDLSKFRDAVVLVTGATGLIGSLLVKSLLYVSEEKDLNVQVLALIRNIKKAGEIYSECERQRISFIEGDLTERNSDLFDAYKTIDYIFHTVAITNSRMMIEDPVDTVLTSVMGTDCILKCAVDHHSKSVVYVSSMEVYGSFLKRTNESVYCTEDILGDLDPLNVRSNYPEGKRLCENLCIAYHSQYHVPVKIARLSQTFGAGILPWDHRVFAQFCESVMRGEDIVLHTLGRSEGNYCYTTDVLRGLLTILLKGTDGEAYNVVNEDTHTTIADMAEMVSKEFGNGETKVVFDTAESEKHGYAADTKIKLSSQKLCALGWKPRKNLREMYERTIAYLSK